MKNKSLTNDYTVHGGIRLEALQVLFTRRGYADVVCEAQDIAELMSKALIRHLGGAL